MKTYCFGVAIEALKNDMKVRRTGWNGKGMHLELVKACNYVVKKEFGPSDPSEIYETLPWIGMKTADGKFVPWLASQTDMLSEDWEVLK